MLVGTGQTSSLHKTSKKVQQNIESVIRTAKPTPRWILGAECHDSPVKSMDDLAGQRGIHLESTKTGPVKSTLPEPCPHPLGFNAYTVLHGPKMIQKCVIENRTPIIITMRSQRVGQEMYRIPPIQCCRPAKLCMCHKSLVAKGSMARS